MVQVDQTDDWKENGAITKLDLYYSWNHGCLQGVKATYGNKASNAKIIGHEKNLYTQVRWLVRWMDDLTEEQSRQQATVDCEQWMLCHGGTVVSSRSGGVTVNSSPFYKVLSAAIGTYTSDYAILSLLGQIRVQIIHYQTLLQVCLSTSKLPAKWIIARAQ